MTAVSLESMWQRVKRRLKLFLLTVSLIIFIVLFVSTSSKPQWIKITSCVDINKVRNVPEKPILVECAAPSDAYDCLCYVNNVTGKRCAITINLYSRLGNNMGEYAALYSLSKLNQRPAFLNREMSQLLRKDFQITLPAMSEVLEQCIKWEDKQIHDYMEDSYAHFEGYFIRLVGTPYSWKFYHQVADEIRREFTFRESITKKAQLKLRRIRRDRNSITYIGVHVRRGDYVTQLKGRLKGVVADQSYLTEATNRFRTRYPNSVFVVVSDDMDWCRNHISNASGDVYFMGNNNQSSPVEDLSLLANCNHTIMTIGSYGYWAGFLAGGDVIYLANYTLAQSPLNAHLRFETVFWEHWEPIAANLSRFGHE